jgi:hypothetical protein
MLMPCRQTLPHGKGGNMGLRELKIVLIAVALLPGWAAAEGTLSPSALLADAAQYDHQHVALAGAVSNVHPRVSHRGNAYETFRLCDSKCVTVFAWGHPRLSAGQHLVVKGEYDSIKHVGRYTFYNEITADEGSP